ncbi:MAG: single-stranded-DNA-specific exonuclease RecJ [Clostridia bacterium]|nr:single-stranded-DNA-specific exonuclease RecJ [Clostridia bacterium]
MEYLLKPNVHLDAQGEKQAQVLSRELKLDPALSSILVSRGVRTKEEAQRFLRPQAADLLDPYLFRDMKKAVSLIGNAAAAGGKIWIHGDYDADGTSAAALLQRVLQQMGADVQCYIPSRTGHGYGLAMETVEEMAGAALLITVDCGTSSVNEIARAKELGIRTIVADHHEPPALLPEPDAMLNPKVPDETFPFRELCGAGVALKLAQALIGEKALDYVDLAAFGTVADVVPLLGENRIIVSLGLEKFNRSPNPGLGALYAPVREKRGALTAEGISFQLAPCVNAAGRMSSARLALDLMVEDRPGAARIIATTLSKLNADRQVRQKQIIQEVDSRLTSLETLPNFIVLYSPTWETGLVGVAASSVCERYQRPALLLGAQGGSLVGSVRSTSDVDAYAALRSVEALLVRFGGHAGACGLTVDEENLPELEKALNAFASDRPAAGRPEAVYDLEEAPPVDVELVRALEKLEPCGYGNPRPLALVRNAKVEDVRAYSGGEHAGFRIRGSKGAMEAVKFRTAPDMLPDRADFIGTLGLKTYRGQESVQMIVSQVSVEDEDDTIFTELARRVCQPALPEDPWLFFADKKRLGLIYSALREVTGRQGPKRWRGLYRGALRFVPGLRREEFVFAVCVFTQLKLLGGTKDARIHVIASAPRRSLDESEIYRKFEVTSHGSQSKDSEYQ